MSVGNVTPRRTVATTPRGRQIVIAVLALIVVVLAIRALAPHANRYEKLARDVTVALQSNDVDAVKRYQNAETATTITRGIVGRAADRLAPLGKIKSVKETTGTDVGDRTHEFSIVFDKGAIRERFKLDPDFKIVHFSYEKATQ